MATQAEFDQMIKSGELIESPNEMTPDYLKELKHTLIVSGDTELISAPAYYLAAKRAPSINAFMTGIAIIQDELAHAHIAYHILEELGEDQEKLIFSRDPKSFRYPYAFDVPLDSWTELVVANGMYDQAGFCLLGDIHEKCSYGPWKRGPEQGDGRGELPPAQRPHLDEAHQRRPAARRRTSCSARSTGCSR